MFEKLNVGNDTKGGKENCDEDKQMVCVHLVEFFEKVGVLLVSKGKVAGEGN